MKCELQPSLLPVQLHRPEQMQVQVLVQESKPLLLPEMVLLVELVPVSEQVPVSMPDPPVDQTDPLTRSVPNPQLDQTELLPLSSARATAGARSVRDSGDRVWSAMISFLT